MTDADLQKLAAVAASFGNCNEAGLLQLFKVVRDDTATTCSSMADEEHRFHGSPGAVAERIRKHFNLSRPPSTGGEGDHG